MPYVICETHGGNGATFVCAHIADRIGARILPGPMTRVDLDGFFFGGWICDSCLENLNSHGLQAYMKRYEGVKTYPLDADLDPLLDVIDLQPVCVKCFEELTALGQLP